MDPHVVADALSDPSRFSSSWALITLMTLSDARTKSRSLFTWKSRAMSSLRFSACTASSTCSLAAARHVGNLLRQSLASHAGIRRTHGATHIHAHVGEHAHDARTHATPRTCSFLAALRTLSGVANVTTSSTPSRTISMHPMCVCTSDRSSPNCFTSTRGAIAESNWKSKNTSESTVPRRLSLKLPPPP